MEFQPHSYILNIKILQLYKGAGEDGIQLFDLSLIPKNHSSSDFDDNSNSLPSMLYRGRCDSLFSFGTLLYRVAHRLSLSLVRKIFASIFCFCILEVVGCYNCGILFCRIHLIRPNVRGSLRSVWIFLMSLITW